MDLTSAHVGVEVRASAGELEWVLFHLQAANRGGHGFGGPGIPGSSKPQFPCLGTAGRFGTRLLGPHED